MPDEYIDLRSESEQNDKPPEDSEKSSWWIGRWAHVIALSVFCLLYFPFSDRFWSWQFAVTSTYVVFIVCCTCGMAFRDSDDFFGNLKVPRYMAKLLIRQASVLALISLGAYLWLRLRTILPEWATHEGRRPSLWVTCGAILAYLLAIKEAKWMAERIKRRFPQSGDSA